MCACEGVPECVLVRVYLSVCLVRVYMYLDCTYVITSIPTLVWDCSHIITGMEWCCTHVIIGMGM